MFTRLVLTPDINNHEFINLYKLTDIRQVFTLRVLKNIFIFYLILFSTAFIVTPAGIKTFLPLNAAAHS